MQRYLALLTKVRQQGEYREDRTGVGTYALFGERLEFDLTEGFPCLTTKAIHWKSVVHELLWFLQGSTNIASLQQNGVHIWDEWADDAGELGPIYGKQWRAWQTLDGEIDQISRLIEGLKHNPTSRRHIVSAWNVGELDAMRLPPCHILFQFFVAGNALSCQVYQRSADMFLGVPFNIASYALLTHLVAAVTGYQAARLVWVGGDVHVYANHLAAADTQLARAPFTAPTLRLAPHIDNTTSIFDITADHITLDNYQHHPAIKAPVAV